MASFAFSSDIDRENGAQHNSGAEQARCKSFAVGCTVAAAFVALVMVVSAAGNPAHEHNLFGNHGHRVAQAFLSPMNEPRVNQKRDYRSPVVKMSTATESPVVAEVMDKLKSMTLLEASELVKAIEETFDVDASAGGGGMMMAMPAAGGAAADAAPAAEAKEDFDVSLDSFPADKKIAVLKVVRSVTGLGLKEAKDFIEAAPKVLKEAAPKSEAEDLKKQLEEVGAVVSLK